MALQSAVARESSPALLLPVRRLPPDGLLATARLLGGADALFELVQRLLGTSASRGREARVHLEALAQPDMPTEDWAEALLRYRQVAEDLRASLAATHDMGQSLLEAGLEDEFGFAEALGLLEDIARHLPPVPPDSEAARQGLEALGQMAAAIALAQRRIAAGHRRLKARLALPPEEGADPEPEPLEGTDLRKEAVRLQALHVRQQLRGHAIGLHALVPHCLRELAAG